MKRSSLKRKEPLTDAQKQIKQHWKEFKQGLGKGKSTTGARGKYYKGEWFPSTWELECYKLLELRELAKEIENLESHVILPILIKNDSGAILRLTIEVDFTYFDKNLNRHCRVDAKQPKTVHTKRGKRNLDNKRKDWFQRWQILQHLEPDFQYVILRQHSTWRGIDI